MFPWHHSKTQSATLFLSFVNIMEEATDSPDWLKRLFSIEPDLPKMIFKELRPRSLLACREVLTFWRDYIDQNMCNNWVEELNGFLKTNFYPKKGQTLISEYPDWKEVCDYHKSHLCLPKIQYLTICLTTIFDYESPKPKVTPLKLALECSNFDGIKFARFLLESPVLPMDFQPPFDGADTLLHYACHKRNYR